MDRKTARAHAMKLIYEWEMGGEGGEDTRMGLLDIAPEELQGEDAEFMNRLVDGVKAGAADIDGRICAHAKGWQIDRIPRVDLAILRVAVCEMSILDTHKSIAINEAVELARQYSTEKAPQFINGVLGAIARDGQ